MKIINENKSTEISWLRRALLAVRRTITEPKRRRRYRTFEREFNANSDRMAWLLAEALADAMSALPESPASGELVETGVKPGAAARELSETGVKSAAAAGEERDALSMTLPGRKIAAPFRALIDRQEELLEVMRDNMTPHTKVSLWMSVMRYDRLAAAADALPDDDTLFGGAERSAADVPSAGAKQPASERYFGGDCR